MIENFQKFTCFSYRVSLFRKLFIFEGGETPVSDNTTEVEGEAPESPEAQSPPDQNAVNSTAERARQKGKLMIEASARIPTLRDEKSKTGVDEKYVFGGEVVGRYVLTDPSKPYVAVTLPLSAKYESTSLITTGDGRAEVTEADDVTVSAGVGFEGGVPVAGFLTLYGGVGVEGGVQVYDYVYANSEGTAKEGTDVSFAPAAFTTAGVRVNPIARWHVYAALRPTVPLTGGAGLSVPVMVGTGVNF